MAMIPFSTTNSNRLTSKLGGLIEMMQQLKSKANDIQNEVRNEELQARKKRKSEVSLWIEQVISFEEEVQSIETEVAQVGFFGHRHLSVKLDGIMERGAQLLQQSEFPRGLLLDDVKPEGLELVTDKMEGSTPSRVHDEVWGCFERGERRVGIFGIGGVGKTSLAMHINNKILKLRTNLFKCVYFVTVSRETSVLKLQSDIANALERDLTHKDEPKRAAELRMTLAKREKSLLILDDLWEDIAMEKVGVLVEGDECKLLITTRKRDVCRKMNCYPVKMDPLLHEESWELFKKQLGNFEALSLEVKNTARLVAEECDGLPLGIVTMARSMRGETCAHVWRDALKRLQNPCSGQHDMKEKVFRILRFSYEQLHDDKHRKCFLYCALYPEDYRIERNKLISEFIAAGLLDGADRQERIDEGHTLLNVLENASLLEFDTVMSNRIKMHDLVRDMAIEILGSTDMVKVGKRLKVIPGKGEWIKKDLQWVSLMFNSIDRIDGVIPDCPNISVLLLQNNPLRSISDCFLVHVIGLKFLNLSWTPIEVLPDSVSNLCNLNTLLLCVCRNLHHLPSLAKLTKLTELNLEECWRMRTLPEGMQELESLEHLSVQGTKIEGMHRGLFSNLLNLKFFFGNSKIVVPAKELLSLRHLEKLTGVHLDGVSWFNQLVDFGCFDQMKPYSITIGSILNEHKLGDGDTDRRIVFNGCRLTGTVVCLLLVPRNVGKVEFWECSFGVKSLLDASPSLGDATELECCQLRYCKGIQYIIPEGWIKPLQGIRRLELTEVDEFCGLVREEVRVHMEISFSGLRVLEIKDCRKLKKLWMLNLDLPNLEEIEIADCVQIEEIFATEKGGIVKLPRLCSLKLRSLPELRSIWGNCNVFFPHLVSLQVIACPAVKKIGMLSYNLLFLKSIQIKDCKQLEEIFALKTEEPDKLPKLCSLEVIECPTMKTTGMTCYNLPSLETVHIRYCEQLEEIFSSDKEEPVKLPKLRSLEVSGCHAVEKIGMVSYSLLSLETIHIQNCKQLEEIFSCDKEEPMKLPKLRSLEVNWCDAVKKIGMVSYSLLSLETIHIQGCKQLEELFVLDTGETIKLPRLRSLDLYNLLELRSIWGTCDAFLPDLVSLDVWNCPILKTTGLLCCNLPSLERIHVQYCKQVEEIFAVEAGVDEIQLPKLKILEMLELPELRRISRETIVCNSLQSVSIGGKEVPKLENCPISVIDNNGPLPVLWAAGIPRGWWDSLHWNDPATKSLFHQLGCFRYSSFNMAI